MGVLFSGHSLYSIRARALQSIWFKLSQRIFTVEEFSVEPALCVNLLEWFNKDDEQMGSCAHFSAEEIVLQLLLDLAKVFLPTHIFVK